MSTNDYDVSQGRQGGGAVNAVTKNGTNELKGTLFFYNRADEFSSQYDIRGVKRNIDFTTNQWGLSLGGPIIKDKLHFFVAFDRQDQKEPVNNADIQSADDELRLGIRKDTLNKFIDIARRVYGVGSGPQVGVFERKTTSNVIFARFDYTLNDKHYRRRSCGRHTLAFAAGSALQFLISRFIHYSFCPVDLLVNWAFFWLKQIEILKLYP